MEYSILKDNGVIDTVSNIQRILSTVGIELDKDICLNDSLVGNPFSIIAFIKGHKKYATNGKGTSLNNAIASGYAEFMERLQAGTLIGFNETDEYSYAPDEVVTKCQDKNGTYNRVTLPFYSLKNKKIEYFDIDKIIKQQSSNGLCAGNTMEEALVQGFSEVCERYAAQHIINNKIKMPDIPADIYMKYDKIKDMIQYYEHLGYKITIKDASLGKKLPVVCLITEYKEEEVFFINFGSSPSLPVSIERCLTELSQGFNMAHQKEALAERKLYMFLSKTKYKLLKELKINMYYSFLRLIPVCEYNDDFVEQFFTKGSDYEFSGNAWISTEQNEKNINLLKFMYQNTLPITKGNIFVRDYSYLGFPTYSIYIPNVSTVLEDANFDNEKIKILQEYNENIVENINDYPQLFSVLDNYIALISLRQEKILYEYIALLAAIAINDVDKMKLYLQLFIEKVQDDKFILSNGKLLISIVKDICNNVDIKTKYTEEELKNFYTIKQSLSFASLKQTLKIANIQNLCIPNKKEDDEIKQIKSKLISKYKENLPQQNNLEAFFNQLN